MSSGRPDWFGTIVSAGKYDTQMIPIAVDETGAILALMKGLYDTALKTIAVDSAGVMKANLTTQDLDFLTVRPAYGEAIRKIGQCEVSVGQTKAMITVTGRGVILGGTILWAQTSENPDAVYGEIWTEETLACSDNPEVLHRFNKYRGCDNPLYLGRWEPSTYKYGIGLSPGTTFETKLEIKAQNAQHATLTVNAMLYYALVPV